MCYHAHVWHRVRRHQRRWGRDLWQFGRCGYLAVERGEVNALFGCRDYLPRLDRRFGEAADPLSHELISKRTQIFVGIVGIVGNSRIIERFTGPRRRGVQSSWERASGATSIAAESFRRTPPVFAYRGPLTAGRAVCLGPVTEAKN